MCLFILGLMATLKIWVSTHLMTMQGRVDTAQTQLDRLHVEANQLLLTEAKLINRAALRSRAAELGYQPPTSVLYVIHP